MIYVYAICDDARQLPDGVPGIGNGPLRACDADGVAAVFSECAGESIPPTPQNVLRHEHVVEALMSRLAVLPVRFGTVLRGPRALGDLLSLNRNPILTALTRVSGCVELGVRVLANQPPERPTPPQTSGRAYLIAKLRNEQARRDFERSAAETAADVHARLTPLAADASMRVTPTPRFLMTGAYLLRRDAVDPFRRLVAELSESDPRPRLLCTGPWPPYHFVPELQIPEAQHD